MLILVFSLVMSGQLFAGATGSRAFLDSFARLHGRGQPAPAQPTLKFERVINRKTGKTLGLSSRRRCWCRRIAVPGNREWQPSSKCVTVLDEKVPSQG